LCDWLSSRLFFFSLVTVFRDIFSQVLFSFASCVFLKLFSTDLKIAVSPYLCFDADCDFHYWPFERHYLWSNKTVVYSLNVRFDPHQKQKSAQDPIPKSLWYWLYWRVVRPDHRLKQLCN